ncbi:26940_t:CDS:2, partial [Racocetra persica]
YPRFPAPVEFIAAVIAYYVHPVNIQTACLIMEGAEFTENIINGVERPVKAAELFAFTLRVRAGNTDVLTDAEENVRQKLRAEGPLRGTKGKRKGARLWYVGGQQF